MLLTARYTLKHHLIIEFGKTYNSYAMTTLAEQKKNGEWKQSNMQLAIDAIKNKEMGFLKASKTVVLKLGSIEPRGFDESVSGVRRRLG